ncbi:MAG: DNA adenine methylase [Phormidium sp. GEM2.Bin31]|nr:DNA adenine methylase [Phormidium sp. BM_Day4_Bin.17]TVR14442.1 MAG: DNA adenine methylase [Phormidium sp. GEM2.Bin31]UCJ14084.1 MAG: DNA adenine methylase [Phormidium sp. PBR-2020]
MPTLTSIRTPLRYPGGKSKALRQIFAKFPTAFDAYREPFVGGGSVFIELKKQQPNLPIWINDLNPDVYCFWKCAQSHLSEFSQEVRQIKETRQDGRELFQELATVDVSQLSELERAIRFFVLNRITFSGTIEAGGYSQKSFEQRFTDSSIDRLSALGPVLEGVNITNLDFSELLQAEKGSEGDRTFIFLDPPYLSATKSKLYGKRGHYHSQFDHNRFAQVLATCPHDWLITYDDSPQVRENFRFANLDEWTLQYGMNNYKQGKANKGAELFIANYSLNAPSESLDHPPEQLTLKL